MKLIDKYILRSFLVPLMYCLIGFILIFIVFNLFENLKDFIDFNTPMDLVLRYNVLLIPPILIYIVPISLMLSILYCLSSLTKNNELTAMRASGISLYRLMFPFMLAGFTASLLVAGVNETFGPWSAYWTDQFLRAEKSREKQEAFLNYNLAYMNMAFNRDWHIGIFDRRSNLLQNITIYQHRKDEGRTLEWIIRARSGQWLDGQWWFSDVFKQEHNEQGRPRGGTADLEKRSLSPLRQVPMFELNETPQDFINELKDAREHPEQFTSRELYAYIQRNKGFSPAVLQRARTDFHSRMAMPWVSLVVTLLGIPFGSQTGRKGVLVGVLLALGLFFGFYTVMTFFLHMGKGGLVSPYVAAWVPNLAFFLLGIILVWRMR